MLNILFFTIPFVAADLCLLGGAHVLDRVGSILVFKHLLKNLFQASCIVSFTLPKTNSKFAPEFFFRAPMSECSSSNHHFSGAFPISFRKGRQLVSCFQMDGSAINTVFLGENHAMFWKTVAFFSVRSRDTASTSTSCLLGCKKQDEIAREHGICWPINRTVR